MRKVLELTFAGEPVEIETVDSGEAAVERASQSAPDVVIADASMSMSGYEVAQQLKSNPATQNVAVIVLASQHHAYDAAKGKECGVDDHVLKPYDSQVMIDKTQEVLSRPRASASGGAVSAPARPVPAAPPQRPSSPGVGRPATGAPSNLRSTVSFGTPQRPVLELAEEDAAPARPAAPKLPPRPPARPARPAVTAPTAPSQPTPSPAPSAAAAATSSSGPMASKLEELGLSQDQIDGVLALSREVIEQVVWEVVPDLAEVIIREEIRRLTAE
ncbi:MAG: response regulator [Sandaracinaceae bacterium]|nr:response regulator [Sandaracinaceae bacterium]